MPHVQVEEEEHLQSAPQSQPLVSLELTGKNIVVIEVNWCVSIKLICNLIRKEVRKELKSGGNEFFIYACGPYPRAWDLLKPVMRCVGADSENLVSDGFPCMLLAASQKVSAEFLLPVV